MSTRSKNLTYYPAEIHKGKDYHVSYYVTNPDSWVLVRKKIRSNRLSGATRDKYTRDLVRTLNEIPLARTCSSCYNIFLSLLE